MINFSRLYSIYSVDFHVFFLMRQRMLKQSFGTSRFRNDSFGKVSLFKTIDVVMILPLLPCQHGQTQSNTRNYLIILPIHSHTWPPLLFKFVPVQVPSEDMQTYCTPPPPEFGTPAIEPLVQLNSTEKVSKRNTNR